MDAKHRCVAAARHVLSGIAIALMVVMLAGTAFAAEESEVPNEKGFSPGELGEASWKSPIPIGTVINAQNWRKYTQYMTVGQQHLFTGLPNIKLPAKWSLTIGPYTNVPPPRKYREDTEKYSGSVGLKELSYGGFLPTNYVAGVPFPDAATNPNDPHRGIKLLYNMYYNYKPQIMYKPDVEGIGVDRFLNVTHSLLMQVVMRMDHISEPGMPHKLPNGLPGIFQTQYNGQILPEQSKYTTVLALYPDNPSQEEEIFVYIPALRRSLRSSSASRCAPFAGGDNFYDDLNAGFNGIPNDFTAQVLKAPKAILSMANRALENTTFKDYNGVNFFWPKPVLGKWEVRPVFPLLLRPIPSQLPGYCYPKKVIYVDTQNYQILGDDRYDASLKFWKAGFWWFWKTPIPNSPGDYTFNSFLNASVLVVDFENQHFTGAFFNSTYLNTNVPKKYRSVQRYASPSGLDEIMQ